MPAADTTSAMEVFAENVKNWINIKGLSVTAVAEAAGLSRPGLSAMLNGRGGNCTLETAEKIAIAVDKPLHELLKP